MVAWRVTSADSHPVSGAFSFCIGEPSARRRGRRRARPSAVVEAFDAIARGIAFLGLALARRRRLRPAAAVAGGPGSRARAALPLAGVGALAGGHGRGAAAAGPVRDRRRFSLGRSRCPPLRAGAARAAAADGARSRVLVARALQRPSRGADDRAPARAWSASCATWTLTDHSRTGVQTVARRARGDGAPAGDGALVRRARAAARVRARAVDASLEPVAAAVLAARSGLLRARSA